MDALYDTIGRSYADTRRPDPRIAAAIEHALEGTSAVVNVGAGAGSYEPPQTRWAIEPSQTMIDQRRPEAVPAIQSTAERIPLADGEADAALAVLTIHHWSDLKAGIAEMRRVAGGRVVILTWDPLVGTSHWLSRDYLPELAAWDATRFLPIKEVAALMGGADTTAVPVPHDCTDGFLGAFWRRPAAYLDPAVRAGISFFAHPDAPSFDAGLARLRRRPGERRVGAAQRGAARARRAGRRLPPAQRGWAVVKVLAHDVAGDGPGLLLVHAGVCDRRMWDGQFENLARDHRVLRVDLRGYGETPEANEPHVLGDDLRDAMDAAGLDRAIVAGNSFGGRASLELAVLHPERVSALLLLASGIPDHDWSEKVRRFGAEEDRLFEAGDIDGAVALNVEMWARGPYGDRVAEMQRRAFDLMSDDYVDLTALDPPLTERVREISCPALIVDGDLDVPDFTEIADMLAERIPNSTRRTVRGAGHLISMDKPDELLALVRELG